MFDFFLLRRLQVCRVYHSWQCSTAQLCALIRSISWDVTQSSFLPTKECPYFICRQSVLCEVILFKWENMLFVSRCYVAFFLELNCSALWFSKRNGKTKRTIYWLLCCCDSSKFLRSSCIILLLQFILNKVYTMEISEIHTMSVGHFHIFLTFTFMKKEQKSSPQPKWNFHWFFEGRWTDWSDLWTHTS